VLSRFDWPASVPVIVSMWASVLAMFLPTVVVEHRVHLLAHLDQIAEQVGNDGVETNQQ
jgi:hypothetical protein